MTLTWGHVRAFLAQGGGAYFALLNLFTLLFQHITKF